ncbi:Shedu immune nuclease family protein [Lysobacter sp. CA199]|uniref:Shedu immune nuclease family protein n=1 Tax=Lysobacter sp. CA199 TaxID=3455608 RepID=UPI003F8D804E
MVEFEIVDDQLHLIYSPRDGSSWVHHRFADGKPLVIKGTFHLSQIQLVEELPSDEDLDPDDKSIRFVIASVEGDYIRFDPEVLPVGCPVLIAKDALLTWKWFTSEKRTSIFQAVADLKPSRIVIGGPEQDAIPVVEYENLVKRFPSDHELKRYVLARVASVVREYTDAKVDAESLYQKYVGKRLGRKAKDFQSLFREQERRKYRYLYDRLVQMLKSEETYSEASWQAEILQIVRLLNPKYIAAFERVPVKDFDRDTVRELDILLVDASGSVDVIEIKKPFDKCIVTEGVYRGNHIPMRELSGSVMQLEKYIYHLNRWGPAGEESLTLRFASKLPDGFLVRITNPCGIIIMGRDDRLSTHQRRDFEVVRRKYKNVVDIMTYDDLLRRLEFVVSQLGFGP